ACRYVDRDLIPRIALGEIGLPALRSLPLMNDGDDGPGNLRFFRHRLISFFGRWCSEAFRDVIQRWNQSLGNLHILPALQIGILEFRDVDHVSSLIADLKPRRAPGTDAT